MISNELRAELLKEVWAIARDKCFNVGLVGGGGCEFEPNVSDRMLFGRIVDGVEEPNGRDVSGWIERTAVNVLLKYRSVYSRGL